jgi:hypothetical protein
LQGRNQSNRRPLLHGKPGALIGTEALYYGDPRLCRVDGGFGRLDACSNRRRPGTRLGRVIACSSGRFFQPVGAGARGFGA